MLLRLQKYDLSVKYVSGKLLHTLSRAHAINNSNQVDDGEMELALFGIFQLPMIRKKHYDLLHHQTEYYNSSLKLDGPTMLSIFLKMYVSTGMYAMKFILPRIYFSWETD